MSAPGIAATDHPPRPGGGYVSRPMSSGASPRLQNRSTVIREISERRDTVVTYPFEIQFSGEHRCNLRCVQCGATVERNSGIEPLMDQRLPQRSLERFRKIAVGLPYWEWLSLTGSGETLINPELPQILEMLAGPRESRVAFNTNGTLWTEERAEMVVKAGVDEIRFSMDGATKETFERIRVNARFEKVLEAVRTLVRVRDQLGATRPKVSFSCNFMRQNIEELPLLIELAHDLGATRVMANNTIIFDPAMADEALVRHVPLTRRMAQQAARRAEELGIEFVSHLVDVEVAGDRGGDGTREKREAPAASMETPGPTPVELGSALAAEPVADPIVEAAAPVAVEPVVAACVEAPAAPQVPPPAPLPVADRLDETEGQAESILPPLEGLPAELPPIVHACQRPWTGLYVENNGWVKVCCFDAPPIGNLDQQSFDEIWNGPAARELRRSFLEDRPPEGCRNCFIFSSHKPSEDVFVQSVVDGRCYIDAPGLDPRVSGIYTVHGWAVSRGRVTRVEILIDGKHHADALYGHERPDVQKVVPGFPEGAQCGFRFDLDTEALGVGEHRLSILVHDAAGGVQEGPTRVILCAAPR